MEDISKRLLAAKQGEIFGPHPLLRRIQNAKGEERLQQLWVSNAGALDWRDIPLFNNKEEYIDEGDSAINTGPLIRAAAKESSGELPKV